MQRVNRRQFFSLRPTSVAEHSGYWLHLYRAAMACRFEVTLPAGAAADLAVARQALDEIDRLENQLTVYRDTSEVSFINQTALRRSVPVEPNLFRLLALAQRLREETDGAFDITAGPLIRCWGFFQRQGRVPAIQELEAARASVGMHHVALDSEKKSIRFKSPNVEINLGSIGKGYALDRVASSMRSHGVNSALLSGGSSSVVAIGSGSGDGWQVGVRHPRDKNSRLAILELRDCAMGTSGTVEQYFESAGKRYGHILDPRSGMPAEGVVLVSVVASSAALSDALATAFFVGGRELAERYCCSHSRVLVLMLEEGDLKPVIIGERKLCNLEVIC